MDPSFPSRPKSDETVLVMTKRWEQSSSNGPEGPIAVPFSSTSYYNLMDKLGYHDRDKKFPRYFFDAVRSEMIVQLMPSPLHRNVPSMFLDTFLPIKSSLPAAIKNRIGLDINVDTNGFTGPYAGSVKISDLSVTYQNRDGDPEVRLVIEVGFAESYDDLMKDARLWLIDMRSVRVVLIAKYQESPKYTNPPQTLRKEHVERLGSDDTSAVAPSHFTMQEAYGPVVYEGFVWAGRIAEAFIEVWKRNAGTGLAEKFGDRIDLFSEKSLKLKLSEFIDVDPEHDTTVSISSQELMDQVKKDLRRLACHRFKKFMDEGKRTPLVDQDYQPP